MAPLSLIVTLLMVVSLPGILGYPSGPPQSTCSSMLPGHGVAPQSSSPPYSITVSQTTYSAGGTIDVTIQGAGSAKFVGFILQARRADWSLDQNERIGKFQNLPAVENAKLITCTNADDTFGHSNANAANAEHSSITIQWLAPSPAEGHIQFRATVVQEKTILWTEIYSDIVEDPSAPTIAPTPVMTQGTAGPSDLVTANDCGSTKGCFADPAGCTGIDDCDLLISWQENGDNVNFQLLGKMRSGEEYVAIGFSQDQKMGDDDVWGCIENGGSSVVLEHSYNPGYSSQSEGSLAGSSDFSGSYTDGVIQCQFSRQKTLTSRKKRAVEDYDLSNEFYLLIARGPKNPANPPTLSKHITTPVISASKIDYTSVGNVGGAATDPKLKTHACLMIIGWIGCASIAIVFARYFKPIWPNSKLLGQKVWFTFHRSLMILNLLCFLVGFVMIFIYVGGFVAFSKSSDRNFVHALMGIIVTALGLTNPIMAAFRPHPGTDNRHIFNWAHWAVGTASHILAIATVFIGMDLPALDLPQSCTWVLLAFVILHVLIELLLEVATCVAKDAERKQSHEIPLQGVNKDDVVDDGKDSDPPESLMKRCLLAVYVIFAIVVVIYLIVSIGLY